MDLIVVHMDDFNVVLGMDFLLEHKIIQMLLAMCIMITDCNSIVIPASIKQLDNIRMFSTLQLKRWLVREEPTFMAISMVEEVTTSELVPNKVRDVLHSYADIMSESLSTLPPCWDIDHETELLPRVTSLAKNAYWMALLELVELRKQLDELLVAGFIRPTNAPYGA